MYYYAISISSSACFDNIGAMNPHDGDIQQRKGRSVLPVG